MLYFLPPERVLSAITYSSFVIGWLMFIFLPKLWVPKRDQAFVVFFSQCPYHLAQCLAHRRHSLNIFFVQITVPCATYPQINHSCSWGVLLLFFECDIYMPSYFSFEIVSRNLVFFYFQLLELLLGFGIIISEILSPFVTYLWPFTLYFLRSCLKAFFLKYLRVCNNKSVR